jgi:hypothetical protein
MRPWWRRWLIPMPRGSWSSPGERRFPRSARASRTSRTCPAIPRPGPLGSCSWTACGRRSTTISSSTTSADRSVCRSGRGRASQHPSSHSLRVPARRLRPLPRHLHCRILSRHRHSQPRPRPRRQRRLRPPPLRRRRWCQRQRSPSRLRHCLRQPLRHRARSLRRHRQRHRPRLSFRSPLRRPACHQTPLRLL